MSTEKRSPTADEIAKLIKQSWNSAGSQYPIVEEMRAALEAQADQLKQAREIMRRVPHQDCRDIETPPDTCRFGATEIWSKRLLCINARAWLARQPRTHNGE